MPDLYLAERLRIQAQSLHQMSSSGYGNFRESRACAAASMLAASVHYSLLGFAVGWIDIEDDVDETPQSLTALARAISNAGIRSFEPFEIDSLAQLDVIHRAPVTRVLLPDQLAQDIYMRTEGFTGNLVQELLQRLKAERRSDQ